MLAAVAVGLVTAVVVRAPRSALYLLIGWLAALGLLRRLLTSADFGGALNDPLLVVAPAVWGGWLDRPDHGSPAEPVSKESK